MNLKARINDIIYDVVNTTTKLRFVGVTVGGFTEWVPAQTYIHTACGTVFEVIADRYCHDRSSELVYDGPGVTEFNN